MHIGIRTDASPVIGTGHLMRCLTLADALRKHDAHTVFIMRNHTPDFIAQVRQQGYEVQVLPVGDSPLVSETDSEYANWLGVTQLQDSEETFHALTATGVKLDWLVVDHYALDKTWESRIRKYTGAILVIDDLANRQHDCDLLLDQNFYENMNNRYTGLIPHFAVGLFGPQFALLRPEFADARKQSRKRDGVIRRVLVFFGGADLMNMTGKTIEAIADDMFRSIQFDVVIGSANPYRAELQRDAQQLSNVKVLTHVERMSDLMSAADLAIGGAGTTSWERGCLGLPTIVIVLAENQREVANALHQAGLAVSLGEHTDVSSDTIRQAMTALISDTGAGKAMSQRCFDRVDGQGTERVVAQMLKYHNANSSSRDDQLTSSR